MQYSHVAAEGRASPVAFSVIKPGAVRDPADCQLPYGQNFARDFMPAAEYPRASLTH